MSYCYTIPWEYYMGEVNISAYTIGVSLEAQMVKNLQQCRKPGFNSWSRKIPWRRAWQPTPVFLPGETHGQRSLVGYSPWGHKESDTTEVT